jgi:DNA polymerase V
VKQPVFALVDCNNFFVSCEKVFRPDLEGKPVVVLSSNDGCVVARSNEAKALGIPMAAPAFKYKRLFQDNGVVQFSANFELYGDVSRRITQLLTSITPRIEIYSVDESFLDLSQLQITDYKAWGKVVREKILQWVGMPVSIGVAPTKTFAKLASDRAKKAPELNGVLNIYNVPSEVLEKHLRALPLGDLWGIGRRLAPSLRAMGLSSAYDIAMLPPKLARQLLGSVHGEQIVRELRGESCYPLYREGAIQKSIARTRTFGEDTSDFGALEAAIATFVTRAAHRLRKDQMLARQAGLFISTNKHKPGYKTWARQIKLDTPSADTGILISKLTAVLKEIVQPHLKYHRAGVWLQDFIPAGALQTDLLGFVSTVEHSRSLQRMKAVDSLNLRYGKDTIRYAAEDMGHAWEPRYNLRSPRYATRWDELPTATIKTLKSPGPQ